MKCFYARAGITTIAGVSALQFRASSSPVIGVLSLAATLNNNGFVDILGNAGTGVFVATKARLPMIRLPIVYLSNLSMMQMWWWAAPVLR